VPVADEMKTDELARYLIEREISERSGTPQRRGVDDWLRPPYGRTL
jgi:hypothetical protein